MSYVLGIIAYAVAGLLIRDYLLAWKLGMKVQDLLEPEAYTRVI